MSEERSVAVRRETVARAGRCMGCHGSRARYVYVIRLHTTEVRLCLSCYIIVEGRVKSL